MKISTSSENRPKVAIFHAFFKNKGGAEGLVFQLRNYLGAHLFTGAIKRDVFNEEKQDSFSQELFNKNYQLTVFHDDANLPVWRHIKRQFFFLFSQKLKLINKYGILIVSGNVFWVVSRLRKMKTKTKIIIYCHTPPRIFTDQKDKTAQKLPKLIRPFFFLLSRSVMYVYKRELMQADLIISNSKNIQSRLLKFTGLQSEVVFPPVDTNTFRYISTQDYYLSHSRLEDMKRIPLIIEAFSKLPEKKLIICSSGPLESWVKSQIQEKKLTNVTYLGLVSQEYLEELVGSCLAGIVIPVDEDAGITQCELMAAGKPVIGVREGGLIETVIHEKTGYLIPSNPSVSDLINGILWMNPQKAQEMKDKCVQHAQTFSKQIFFDKINEKISSILE